MPLGLNQNVAIFFPSEYKFPRTGSIPSRIKHEIKNKIRIGNVISLLLLMQHFSKLPGYPIVIVSHERY